MQMPYKAAAEREREGGEGGHGETKTPLSMLLLEWRGCFGNIECRQAIQSPAPLLTPDIYTTVRAASIREGACSASFGRVLA